MVDIIENITLKSRVEYDISNGDTILNLGSSIKNIASIFVELDTVSLNGISFRAVHSNDGDKWSPIEFYEQKQLVLTNDTGDDTLEFGTDLFTLGVIGIQIIGSGGATGTVRASASFK
jgi:hypothetical protein